jgi:spore coat protein CotF
VGITQEFIAWMIKNDYLLKDIFPGADFNTLKQIQFGDFQKEIKYKKFKSSDEMELLRSLDKTKSNKSVDVAYLKDLLTKAKSKVKVNTGTMLSNFPPKVKAILDKIESSMAK